MHTDARPPDELGDHLLIATANQDRPLRHVRATLMRAHSLPGTLLGCRLVDLRASGDRLMATQSEIEELHARAAALEECVALLGARCDMIPDRRRPHYTPEQRFRIVRIRRVLHLPAPDTAHLFRVSADTIYEWDREAREDPDRRTIGSLVQITPPVRRYADVVHHLVQSMAALGFGGHQKVAEYLANAATLISERTVGRYRKEKPVRPPRGAPEVREQSEAGATVTAR